MVLDADEARTVLGVLATTAAFAVILAVVASAPLGRDAARLEAAVRRIEAGDRTGRTGVQRADELGHVARALDELTERLDQLERERPSFEHERRTMLSSVGHDLRTPLAALRAAVEALADGVAPDPDRYLRAMARDVEALSALVDDLFLLASIESRRLELPCESLDLAELADEAVEALSPAAAAGSVTLARRRPGPRRHRRQRGGHRADPAQPDRQRHPPRTRLVHDRHRRHRWRCRADHRPRARLPRRVLGPRLRALRPRRSQPLPRAPAGRARTGNRPRAGRSPRRPDLDRARHWRPGRLPAARRLMLSASGQPEPSRPECVVPDPRNTARRAERVTLRRPRVRRRRWRSR